MAPHLAYDFRDAQGSVYLLQSDDIGRIEQRVKLVKKRPFIALALTVGQGTQQLFQGVPKLVPAITNYKEMTDFKRTWGLLNWKISEEYLQGPCQRLTCSGSSGVHPFPEQNLARRAIEEGARVHQTDSLLYWLH